jgi:hypothetical protein
VAFATRLVDTLGLLLNVIVHPADAQDRDCYMSLYSAIEASGKPLARISHTTDGLCDM